MRKIVRQFAAACVGASMLAGCATAFSRPHTVAAIVEPITLSLMLPQTHYKDFFQEALRQFEREYPEYRIDAQRIPDNQWIDLVKMKAAVKETPDIIRIDKGLISEVGAQYFVAFDESAPWYDRVIPEQRENKQVNGVLYGLPINSNSTIGVVYNKRIFEQYHLEVPRTWEAFLDLCHELQENGITPLYATDKDSWTAQVAFDAAAPQSVDGAVWVDIERNRLRWAEVPEFSEALNAVAQLRYEGLTNKDYLDATYASAVVEMSLENAAMYIMGEFFIYDVLQVNPDIQLSMMALPYGRDVLTMVDGPGQLSIFQNSQKIEAAQLFLNWFSQPENMDTFTSGWSCMAVFVDQNQQLTEWQASLMEEYITKGKTVLELSEIIVGVDYNDFWNYQQEMFAGTLSAIEVLERWDIAYAQQMRDREEPGW